MTTAMNSKIAFPELIDLVAQATNSTKRVSELFLKELFATITQALAEDESVKVKGLGTFKLTEVSARKSVNVNTGETIEIPGHNKLSFVPEKSLAEAVNKPFAQFETVVLSDDVTDEQLQAIDAGQQPAAPIEPTSEPEQSAAPEPTELTSEPEQPADATEQPEPIEPTVEPEQPAPEQPEPIELTEPEQPAASEPEQPTPEPEPVQEPTPPPFKAPAATMQEPKHHHHHHYEPADNGDDDYITYDEIAAMERKATVKGFLWGVMATLVLCGVAAFLYIDYSGKSEAQPAELVDDSVQPQSASAPAATAPQPKAKPDSAASQPKAEQKQPEPQKEADAGKRPTVYDTTSRNYVLSKMAQKHYGNQCFWVYIYQENKSKIKDPNNIPEGTRLVIPAKEKYGIDSRDKASRDKAKKIAYNLLKDK